VILILPESNKNVFSPRTTLVKMKAQTVFQLILGKSNLVYESFHKASPNYTWIPQLKLQYNLVHLYYDLFANILGWKILLVVLVEPVELQVLVG